MKTAILESPKNFKISEQPVPKPRENEVLIQTRICGICTSELDIWSGVVEGMKYPMFIGHEVAGTIVETGSNVINLKAGDPVSVWTEQRGYAEYLSVEAKNVYKLQDEKFVDFALGEPISCSVNGVRKLNMDINESVCIVGCGFMGLIILQILKIYGASLVIAIDTRDFILNKAQQLGATHIFNPKNCNVVEEIKSITNGKGIDIGVEAAGNQKSLDLTADIVRMEGKLEIFGFHQGAKREVNWGYWNWMAFQIINGHSRSADIYRKGMQIGLRLLEMEKINVKELITHRFSLYDINQGFQTAIDKPNGFIKGMIHFS